MCFKVCLSSFYLNFLLAGKAMSGSGRAEILRLEVHNVFIKLLVGKAMSGSGRAGRLRLEIHNVFTKTACNELHSS